MEEAILVGEHPPRQKADPREDPWHPATLAGSHPERWTGAETAYSTVRDVNLKNAAQAIWNGGGVARHQASKPWDWVPG